MSDLAKAAEALGIPEALVRRSAEARAAATGVPVDDIIAAWASGGEAPATEAAKTEPTPATPPEPAPEAAPTPEETPSEPAPAPAPPEPTPAAPPRAATQPTGPPPVLVGRRDRPFLVLWGAIGLFTVALLLGFVAPSIPEADNGVYSSKVSFSEAGLRGKNVYLREGCAACHTQMVRPVVADAELGGVTVADSNQVLGLRRIGPDLTHVGSRLSDTELSEILRGSLENHPSYAGLDEAALADLVTYLSESS